MRSVPRGKLVVLLAVLVCCVASLSWYVGGPAATEVTAQTKSTSSKTLSVYVDIEDAKSMHIDKTKTALDKFEPDLKSLIDRDPEDVVIHLRCAKDLPMSELFIVQDVLIRNGFIKVSYENGGNVAMPLVLPPKYLEERMKTIPAEYIVNIYVSRDGVVFEDRKVSVDGIDQLVEQRLGENENLIFSIHAKPDATYQDFVVVLREVKQGNAERIFIKQPAFE